MTDEIPDYLVQADPKYLRLEADYSDDDLLRELRRRGRLARIEAHSITPGPVVADGCGMDYQTPRTCREIADGLARFILSGRTMPGYSVADRPRDRPFSPYPKDREERIVLNFVVNRK